GDGPGYAAVLLGPRGVGVSWCQAGRTPDRPLHVSRAGRLGGRRDPKTRARPLAVPIAQGRPGLGLPYRLEYPASLLERLLRRTLCRTAGERTGLFAGRR